MTKLHHHAQRYEIQAYVDHTMSWKPVAHASDLDTARAVQALHAVRKTVRILDRINGVNKSVVVK